MSRIKRAEKAQIRTLLHVPFFAPGIARLPVVFDDVTETACTDGKEVRFGTKFFDSLTDDQVVTVLCHEVCHCMLGHLWRAAAGCDWEQWNIATDHAVNLMLKEFSAQVMAGGLADPFPFPDPQDAYCADPQYAGLAEEVIYGKLPKRPPGGGGNKPGKGGKAGQGKPGAGSMPSFGQMTQPKNPTPANKQAQKQLANQWQNALVQAAQMAKGRGDLPGSMERLIDGIINPKVPWQEILRSWLREQASDDWDFTQPAPEYSDGDFLMPSMRSEKIGTVVFATDTSGSINHDLLKVFQGEKQNCMDDMRPSKVVDIYCDTAINLVKEYQAGDTIGKQAPGGGGTSFVPVWEHIETMPERPKAIVYLTDLDGDFGSDPGVPVIWVTWTKGGNAPFGEVVYVGE